MNIMLNLIKSGLKKKFNAKELYEFSFLINNVKEELKIKYHVLTKEGKDISGDAKADYNGNNTFKDLIIGKIKTHLTFDRIDFLDINLDFQTSQCLAKVFYMKDNDFKQTELKIKL